MTTQNQFEHLGQDDTTAASEDIIDTRFRESGNDTDSTTPSTARAIEDLARTTDDTIAEINAILASSPVFSDDLHRLEQLVTSRISSEINKISSEIGVIEETMSSLFATLQRSLANTAKELIADINHTNSNMILCKERVERDHVSVTKAITTLSSNTARLSEETTALSVRVVERQDHLENLLGFEEARRAQMDDHWRSIVEIKSAVEEAQSAATKQADRFTVTAQLDGLRATTDQTTNTLRVDLNDLRGRIIPLL